jgi:AAA15 family ATPase/GTPase
MIKTVTINNFIGFERFEITNAQPINVIIGGNDSGKTGLLKLLYSTSKSYEDFITKGNPLMKSYSEILSEKLLNTFQPRKSGLGELVTKGSGEKLQLDISYRDINASRQQIRFSFGDSTQKKINDCTADAHIEQSIFNTLFVPAKEVLTSFEAIAITREQHQMIGFDDTYYDLIVALRVPTQQGNVISELVQVNRDLEELFGGIIKQNTSSKENPFTFSKGNKEFTMPLTAEGIKKIGILTTLIRNRKLGKNSILFMDEPETALHPNAIRKLAEMIVSMSEAGVQVFLTTHNYFMIKQLAIISKRKNKDINCISLEKMENGTIGYTVENLKDGLPSNSIVSEALLMFQDELRSDLEL